MITILLNEIWEVLTAYVEVGNQDAKISNFAGTSEKVAVIPFPHNQTVKLKLKFPTFIAPHQTKICEKMYKSPV